jgi:predicted nucleotidyltransferase component of viral defense system
MQGLAIKTIEIFERLSLLNCVKDYTLIGGTALSLQIGKRLSEDLDFCKWSVNLKTDKPKVDWPQIEAELATIGTVEKTDILGFDHVNFIVNGVKITFLTKQDILSPVKTKVSILNNIKAADIDSIGAMKIELILRRSEWRDYYDIYSILKEGISLKSMIDTASSYSNHRLKTRDALNFLSNSINYKRDMNFHLLNPEYNIEGNEIEEFIKLSIKKEFKY